MTDTIFIAAPQDTTWPLELGGFERQLRTRWSDVHTWTRHNAITDQDFLSFEMDMAGERRHGAYFDRHLLVLEDGTPDFWTDTIAWFLSLLPVDAEVVCMTETVPEPVPMPRRADPRQIVAVLESLGS